MAASLDAGEKRVLNPRPLKHYRRTYSVVEVRLGLGVLVTLAAIAAWIAYRGAHPDPSLFVDPATLLDPGKAAVDRGALPKEIAADGFREGPVARFEASTLYQKINGRADFFLVRGFKSMTFVSLTSQASPATAVDLELYDLGTPENALGALSGEKPEGASVDAGSGSTWYVSRNALFVARGPLYARVIGTDESPEVMAQLEHVRRTLDSGLAASEKPWAFALLESALGVPAEKIAYTEENAFSFAFGKAVYAATLADGETEAFLAAAPDETSARELARQYQEGFLGYGSKLEKGGQVWIKDRYLGNFAGVRAVGSIVAGVRGAPSVETGEETLRKLSEAGKGVNAGGAR